MHARPPRETPPSSAPTKVAVCLEPSSHLTGALLICWGPVTCELADRCIECPRSACNLALLLACLPAGCNNERYRCILEVTLGVGVVVPDAITCTRSAISPMSPPYRHTPHSRRHMAARFHQFLHCGAGSPQYISVRLKVKSGLEEKLSVNSAIIIVIVSCRRDIGI